MKTLSFYDWLWIARCSFNGEELSYPKRIQLRVIIEEIKPEHRNSFEYLEPAFIDTKLASMFLITWSQYCDYLCSTYETISGCTEWIFDGNKDGAFIRHHGGDAIINAAWWFMKTGEDPIGIFDSSDLPVIEETFKEPVRAETREQVIEWLEKKMKESDQSNERR